MRIRIRYAILGALIAALAASALTMAYGTVQSGRWAKLDAVYQLLEKEYVEPVDADKLMNGALQGMMKALDDPYTVYMDQDESKGFEESISSSFVGIGAEVEEQDGKIVIVSPIKGAPAEKAGLKPNDRVLKVGETSLEGMKTTEAVKHLRGEKGTKAELTIERPGEAELLQITIVRDTIPIETVYSEMKDNGIGVIQISKVSEATAKEFAKHLKELQDKGVKGLVLDLRQNPGGLLDVSFEIAQMLLPADKVVLKVEDRNGASKVYRTRGSGSNPSAAGIPMVGLIDGGTASAGEILAGALQESAGVKLVGQKTYGKGTAQAFVALKDGSTVKYTNAKWLTPGDKWINKTGISPDVDVALPEYASLPYVDPDKEWRQDSYATEVKSIQVMLAALGFDTGRADGYFDGRTALSVTAFQKAQGLEPNGIAAGQTVRRMMELLGEELKKNDPQMAAAVKLLTPN
jgi:carboxyl-terminal processing protease